MKRISAWAITHPAFPLVLFAVLTVFGIVAFVRLPITLNPDISAPFVQVTISEPGAAPAEIETQILQKVEGGVANVGNVKNITSWATEGVAQTIIEFQIGTSLVARNYRRGFRNRRYDAWTSMAARSSITRSAPPA